jgi:hypothetical protein
VIQHLKHTHTHTHTLFWNIRMSETEAIVSEKEQLSSGYSAARELSGL